MPVPAAAAGAQLDVSVELTAAAGATGRAKSVWRFEEAAEADLLPAAEEVSFLRGG